MTQGTSLLAVLGYPVAHSLSPGMHEAAFAQTGIRARYIPIEMPPERLASGLAALKQLGFRGVNLTIPLKELALPFMDSCTDEARRVGAVNTVLFEEGKTVGDTTDGRGWLTSLQEELSVQVAGSSAAIIGAGGAARSIADALLSAHVDRVVLYNRNEARARQLASELAVWHGEERVCARSLPAFSTNGCDLLVQTTPLGMSGHAEGVQPVSLPEECTGLIVSDIVYRPLETPLLAEARRRGARVHGGLGMLVHQGALAFERWFGVSPSTAVMKAAVLRELQVLGG